MCHAGVAPLWWERATRGCGAYRTRQKCALKPTFQKALQCQRPKCATEWHSDWRASPFQKHHLLEGVTTRLFATVGATPGGLDGPTSKRSSMVNEGVAVCCVGIS